MLTRRYRNGLAAVLTETAFPYGYALTVWSSGEILRKAHHAPSLADIFLFIIGAAAGYGLLRLSVGDAPEDRGSMGTQHVIRAGAAHLVAITGAAGVALAAARAPALPAWPLAPFAATMTYLAVVAAEQAIERHEQDGDTQ